MTELIPMINDTGDAMHTALVGNDVAEYERLDRVFCGLLIAYTGGDSHYAVALRNLWMDSQEHIEWYVKEFSRDAAVLEWSGMLSREEYNMLYDKLYGGDE